MPQFESDFEQNLFQQRLDKLDQIRAIGQRLGLTPAQALYPNRFPAADEPLQLSHIPHILARYDTPSAPVTAEQLEAEPVQVAVAGRLMSHRLQGKAGFAHLQGGGKRLQIYIRKDEVGEDAFALYKLLDLGDHIGIRGHLMRTRTGELTLKATPVPDLAAASAPTRPAISFLAKAMLALPDKYHGLEDVELRYRQRYVDLIMNSGTLAKAEPIVASQNAVNPALVAPATSSNLSSRSAAEGSAVQPATEPGAPSSPAASSPVKVGEAAANIPPGTSTVTDATAPDNEHLDAPRNVREVFVKRAQILRAIRRFFDDRGFLEVETPMMHTVAGGAAARPFTTHHNALDLDLALRIAPELYLKRLVVGGLDRVYEINRNFRNEGISTQHNPEFTMLEFYQAYSNYHDLMDLTQELITQVATEVNGSPKTHFNGHDIDLSQWQKLTMREAIVKWWPDPGIGTKPEMSTFNSLEQMGNWVKTLDPGYDAPDFGHMDPEDLPRFTENNDDAPKSPLWQQPVEATFAFNYYREVRAGRQPLGKAIAEIFELVAEPHLIQPTIIYDFPLAVSPLSKVKPDDPDWTERFEFYIGGFEVGNAFSELNDPLDQERRFQAQVADKDPESMAEVDHDYLRALGIGLPPTAGEGIGIDRLTMLLTGSRSIRDVILFPLLRPRPVTQESSNPKAHAHGESAE